MRISICGINTAAVAVQVVIVVVAIDWCRQSQV